MKSTIVLSSTFPCEIGAAALYHCLDDDSVVVAMAIPEAAKLELTMKKIQECNPTPKQIIMIGTYWTACLSDLLNTLKNTVFTVYCFGELLHHSATNLQQFSGNNGTGPTKFLLDLAKQKCQSEKLVKLFENKFKNVMIYIDDRIYNRNILENQIFYTGIFNYDSFEVPLFDKFIKLFQGDYDLDKILQSGQAIVSAQIGMCRERATNNSKVVVLENGMNAVVTEASDLVNLTHDALHYKYPDVPITIAMYMRFGKEDSLAYSIRSFDKSTDASILAKKVNGDGNNVAAGGRVPFVFPVPF